MEPINDNNEHSAESKAFNRKVKRAIIIFAIVEFIVTALVMIHMARR